MLQMLDDVSVLDAGHVLAGPFSTYQLAMLGARVTRVENPRGNDFARRNGGPDALRAAGMGASFLAQNANKRSLAMDLKDPRGRDLFRRVAARADVVTENTVAQAQRLCTLLDCPAVMEDARMRDWNAHPELVAELRPLLEAQYARLGALEWERRLGAISVPAAKVRDLGEALGHPQVHARGFLERAGEIPVQGGPLRVPGAGFAASAAMPRAANAPPPVLGEHTEQVLRELGLSSEDVDVLFADAVVAGPREGGSNRCELP